MLGLFENIGYALEPIGLAIEGAFVKTRCEVANRMVDVRCRRKIKRYEKMRRESREEELEVEEEGEDSEEQETSEDNDGASLGMMAKTFISTSMPKPEYKQDNCETEEGS